MSSLPQAVRWSSYFQLFDCDEKDALYWCGSWHMLLTKTWCWRQRAMRHQAMLATKSVIGEKTILMTSSATDDKIGILVAKSGIMATKNVGQNKKTSEKCLFTMTVWNKQTLSSWTLGLIYECVMVSWFSIIPSSRPSSASRFRFD